jgi:replicative DNA helicase
MQQLNSNKKQIVIDKYLPHNFLAEKMILSCLLINSEALEILKKTISVEVFYFKNHQEIYKAILYMSKKNMPIDILTLLTFLQDNGLLQKIGGLQVLIELLSQTPNIVYLEDYIRLIKEKYIRRSLIKLGYETINSSYITSLSIENIINELENKLLQITSQIKTEKVSSSAELVLSIFNELKQKSLNPKLSGVTSGFSDLDSLTQGFQKSDLIILAGRPSMGKTALSLNIAANLIKTSKLPVLFFSLEMSKEQIMYRLLAMETNINQMKLKSGKLYQDDWIKLTKMLKIISKFPFFIDDKFDLTIQDIRSKIKTILFEQNQLGLVIIDYIQLLQSPKLITENRVQELSSITRSLKTMAREFNIPIIGLSQLSRNVENRMNKKPILSDLRESGSIEQDADLVLMLYKNNSNEELKAKKNFQTSQLIELIIAKQRNGPTGLVRLQFDEEKTKFYNEDSEN